MQGGDTVDLRELFSQADSETSDASQYSDDSGLSRIVRAATALQARGETLSAVRCLNRKGCDGFILVRLQDIPPTIYWRCRKCSTGGTILNWPRTPWDLSDLGSSFENGSSGSLYEIPLAPSHYDSLLDQGCRDAVFQKIIYSAKPRRGVIMLQGRLPDFLYLLERCIEQTAAPNSDREAEALSRICASLDATIRDLERSQNKHSARPAADLDDVDLPGWLPRDLADRLRSALEDGQFNSIDDLNDQLALTMDAYNRRPSPDLAGLSPYQVSHLLEADWNGSGILSLNSELSHEQLHTHPYYNNARILLETVRESGGVAITARGNLRRNLVKQLMELCSVPVPPGRTTNEQDVVILHIPRVICQLGGLIRRRGRSFRITRRGMRLLKPELAGELYCHLFETFFRKFNLAYIDGTDDNQALQDTVAFSFYALSRQSRRWQSPGQLAPKILIPAAYESALNGGDELPGWQAYTRLLLPLYYFGLLEFRTLESGSWAQRRQFRPSPLFSRFFRFAV